MSCNVINNPSTSDISPDIPGMDHVTARLQDEQREHDSDIEEENEPLHPQQEENFDPQRSQIVLPEMILKDLRVHFLNQRLPTCYT